MTRRGSSIRILYIEDNPANIEVVTRFIKTRPGMRLQSVTSGQAGLEAAAREIPDLILLDLHLPGLHGDEVLRRLRAKPATAGIPVAILSAEAAPAVIRHMRASGVIAYLTKPLDLAELGRLLHSVAAGHDTRPARPPGRHRHHERHRAVHRRQPRQHPARRAPAQARPPGRPAAHRQHRTRRHQRRRSATRRPSSCSTTACPTPAASRSCASSPPPRPPPRSRSSSSAATPARRPSRNCSRRAPPISWPSRSTFTSSWPSSDATSASNAAVEAARTNGRWCL